MGCNTPICPNSEHIEKRFSEIFAFNTWKQRTIWTVAKPSSATSWNQIHFFLGIQKKTGKLGGIFQTFPTLESINTP